MGFIPPVSRVALPVSRAASLALRSYNPPHPPYRRVLRGETLKPCPFIQDSLFFPLEMIPLLCAVSIAVSRECVSAYKESTPQPPPAVLVRVRVHARV